ncbi:MAG: tyrosine--tRNA ligase [Acidimicrobiales bacterium]
MGVREDWEFRGLVHQCTDEAVFDQLDAGSVTAYIGFDPTAPSLHLGSLLQLCTLRRIQLSGNRPIALAGGGTGLIGDPTFKDAERPLLTLEQIEANVQGIRPQLERFLDFSSSAGPARALLLNNAQWLTEVSLTEFLRDVGKHVTVNQMTAKESVRARLEREDVGLSFTEFSYMLLQGYDFVRLNLDHGCTLQLGGSDQWGNITVGTELVRKMTGHHAYGLTTPLLLRGDGRKFGKSDGGNENIWLDATMTSPFAMYQYLVNLDDVTAPASLRFFTFLSNDEIVSLDESTLAKPHERLAQRALAREVVTMVHGEDAARKAERASEALFNEAIDELDETTLLEVVRDAPSSTWARTDLARGLEPAEVLVRTGLAKSKGEARRFVEQGGVYVNNRRVEVDELVDGTRALHGKYLVIRRGRRELHLVVLT